MKLKIKLINLLIPLFSFVLCLGVVSCKKQEKNIQPPENIRVENDTLLWNAVSHAEWYLLDIDGSEYETDEPYFDLFVVFIAEKTYQIKIKSVGDETFNYRKSEWSPVYEYVLNSTPLYCRIINDNEYEIKPANPTELSGTIVLPSAINGLPVTTISPSAFKGATKLTSIIIPDSVLEIGNSAFSDCTNLQRIRMPKNLKKISNLTFYNCLSLQEVRLPVCDEIQNAAFSNCQSLKSLRIPQQIKEIDHNIIENCNALTSLIVEDGNRFYRSEGNCIIEKKSDRLITGCSASEIPSGIKTIAAFSFVGVMFEDFSLPSTIETIEYFAFVECSSQSFYLPENVIDFYGASYSHGVNLTKLSVHPSNPVFKSENNCIIRKSDNTLILGCQTSVIPQYVTAIGDEAFEGSELKEIEIPVSVKQIGESAFKFCGSLKELRFSSGLLKIAPAAFKACKSLEKVYFPDGLLEIGAQAFQSCSNLTYVRLPYGLQSIGARAFYATSLSYKTVEIPKTVTFLGAEAFSY